VVPEWFPDDFDFGGFDAFVHEHAVLDLLDEEGADGAGGGSEGHVNEGVAFFVDVDLVDQAEVDDAEVEFGVDDFVEFFPVGFFAVGDGDGGDFFGHGRQVTSYKL